MTLKEKLLEKLEQSEDYLSGEALAEAFGVSRAAIWKGIKALENEGHEIIALQKKGYLLKTYGEKLDSDKILSFYQGKAPLRLEVHEALGSTNDYLKTLAEKGEHEWLAVLAERQTSGKGRLGRSFYSPKGTGIYLSVLLRPKLELKEASLLTILGATVVAKTIEAMLDKEVEIKWVNDIFIEKRKVSGILSEASLSLESKALDYVILGMGINVVKGKGLPSDLDNTFGALFEGEAPQAFRNEFVGTLLTELSSAYERVAQKDYLDYYREKSMVIGKEVYLVTPHQKEKVYVKAIDDFGALIIKDEKGNERLINSGEVSLRFE